MKKLPPFLPPMGTSGLFFLFDYSIGKRGCKRYFIEVNRKYCL